MKIGDRIYVRGYIDEIRKDTIIVRNDGGYFGAIPSEVITGELPSAQPETEWNNHTVACLLAELFGDACACNYNGIGEWSPKKCEAIDACPNPVGVACWEQFLKHRAGRRTDDQTDKGASC